MAVSLSKGVKVSLKKQDDGLGNVIVGLGWDVAQKTDQQPFDCDAFVFALGADGNLATRDDVVYFGNLSHNSGCIRHMGDNRTGEGEGDDEQIRIALADLPAQYERIVVLASVYKAPERRQNFGLIARAFIRIVNADTGREICVCNLTENFGDAVSLVFGELKRDGGAWNFTVLAEPRYKSYVSQLAELYGLPQSVWKK